MKVYIAGPITIDPDNWERHFADAEQFLREKYPYAEIVNPLILDQEPECIEARADLGDGEELWRFFLKRDLRELLNCTHIYCLKGWENSKGTLLELRTAVDVGIIPMFEV